MRGSLPCFWQLPGLGILCPPPFRHAARDDECVLYTFHEYLYIGGTAIVYCAYGKVCGYTCGDMKHEILIKKSYLLLYLIQYYGFRSK